MYYWTAVFQKVEKCYSEGPKKISLSASYCTTLSAEEEPENDDQDKEGGIDIMKKAERETDIFPLHVSGSLVCDMSISMGTSFLPTLFFLPFMLSLLLHPLYHSISLSFTDLELLILVIDSLFAHIYTCINVSPIRTHTFVYRGAFPLTYIHLSVPSLLHLYNHTIIQNNYILSP